MIGGPGSDRLFGGDNGLVPQFEDAPSPVGDTLVPGPGDDLVDLGANTVVAGDYNSADTLDLTDAAAGVTLDLVAGTAVGEGTDVIVVPAPASSEGPAVEVLGSVHADRILGTEGNDHLVGQGGGGLDRGPGVGEYSSHAFMTRSSPPRPSIQSPPPWPTRWSLPSVPRIRSACTEPSTSTAGPSELAGAGTTTTSVPSPTAVPATRSSVTPAAASVRSRVSAEL